MAEQEPILITPFQAPEDATPAVPTFRGLESTQAYRGHICTPACSDIPDSGVYDTLSPGLNPTLERSPEELAS